MSQSRPDRSHRVGDPGAGIRSSRIGGFTLIEILVAFVITAMGLGALYGLASTGLATEGATSRYSRALLIAQSALDDVGVETALIPGTSTRRVDDVYRQETVIRARPDLLRGDAAVSAPYPYDISVKVIWREGKRSRSVDLSTIRLGPAP